MDIYIDMASVLESGLAGAGDFAVLARAADPQRVLLTHDVTTITRYAYERVRNDQPMPGVFEVSQE